MERRKFLGTLSIGVVSTAGCSAIQSRFNMGSENEENSGRSLTMSSAPTEKFKTPTKIEWGDYDIEQFSKITIEVGATNNTDTDSRIRPNEILLLNAATIHRLIEFQLIDKNEDAIILHDIHELKSNTALRIRVNEPSEYVLNVYVPETDTGGTIRIAEFDCNRRGKIIKAPADGELKLASDMTLMDCN